MSKNNYGPVVIQGPTGSGKTTFLLNKYQELVNQQGVPSEAILVLVANRVQKAKWQKGLQLKNSGPRIITSYFGFIQQELRQYWPLIQNRIENWGVKRLEPLFLTIESSQYLMGQLVQSFREKGKLLEVVSSSDRIAIELLQNLSRAVMGGIAPAEIGERLYRSWENKEQVQKEIYQDAQAVINLFRLNCLEKGLLDYSLAVELYHTLLLADQYYQQHLLSRIKYLLVDNLEESVVRQLDLIKFLLAQGLESYLAYCPTGGYSGFAGAVPQLSQELIRGCEIRELKEVWTASPENKSFGETLFANIIHQEEKKVVHQHFTFLQTELRSSLLEQVAKKIISLLKAGVLAQQIAVLAPYVDNVIEFVLQHHLNKEGYKITNLTRKSRMLDNTFIQALVTLACLAHPQWGQLPSVSHLADTLGLVLGLDPVRSGFLGEEIAKKKPYALPDLDQPRLRQKIGFAVGERYEYLRQWLLNYQGQGLLPINSFFQLLFTEILSPLPQAEENILACRQLIESANQFLATLQAVEGEQAEHNLSFIQFLQEGVKGAENLSQIAQKLEPQGIILASPYVYLASSLSSTVQVWLDLSSEQWYRSDVQELANVHVLLRSWPLGEVWNQNLDLSSRREKAAVLLSSLCQRCSGSLLLASSFYSSQGYEQEGWVEPLLQDTLEGGQ